MRSKKIASLMLCLMLLFSLSIGSYASNESDINPICTLEEHEHSVEISPASTYCCTPNYRTRSVTRYEHKRVLWVSDVPNCELTVIKEEVCTNCGAVWSSSVITSGLHVH